VGERLVLYCCTPIVCRVVAVSEVVGVLYMISFSVGDQANSSKTRFQNKDQMVQNSYFASLGSSATSQQYFSLRTNQHQPPAKRTDPI
jgi:hypothetical protein